MSHTSFTVDEEPIFRSILDRLGKRESQANMEGACAYLYDMTRWRPVAPPNGGQISGSAIQHRQADPARGTTRVGQGYGLCPSKQVPVSKRMPFPSGSGLLPQGSINR
jgi:hypothetical protein